MEEKGKKKEERRGRLKPVRLSVEKKEADRKIMGESI